MSTACQSLLYERNIYRPISKTATALSILLVGNLDVDYSGNTQSSNVLSVYSEGNTMG